MRVISLIPSATEIVCALGYQDQIVGRSHECDFPEGIENIPICSESKFNPHEGSSKDIHDNVVNIVSESLSVYRVDSEKLKELQPDIIVTQAQCEVCAVSLKDVEKAVCDWVGSKPKIVSLEPMGLDDLWVGIRQVAEALGNPQKGEEIIKAYKNRMAEIADKTKSLTQQPSVACIEWLDPLMMTANWMPEFIELLGGKNLFGEAGKNSTRMKWEDLKDKDPDVLIGMPCGWDMKRCRQEIGTLTQKSGWDDLKAVQKKRVYLTDGHQYFNRPGPRLVESLEILSEIMYPDNTQYGYEGKAWEKL
jgi:iron complex transport system substrate-binding protein